MIHHSLDPYPEPKEKSPLYVNEPQLIDKSLFEFPELARPVADEDNARIYVPLDLSRDLILRRLDRIILQYGETNEGNEGDFSTDVDMLISQIEIYDQIWYVRHMPEEGKHSAEAISLVEEFIDRLKEIPDGCAECFPFEMIEELEAEYLNE